MIDFFAFALWVLLLLVTPGPTNTLLAFGGTLDGPKAFRLVIAELAGYSISIGSLTFLILTIPVAKDALPLLRLLCGLFVMGLAVRTWRNSDANRQTGVASVRFSEVLVTTILNPKGLIFAVHIFPAGGFGGLGDALPYFGIFAVICLVVGSIWTLLGCLIKVQLADVLPHSWLTRIGAVALFGFGMVLIVTGAESGFALSRPIQTG